MSTPTTKIDSRKTTAWTCPKCKRKFQRHGQLHSCRAFPIGQHFAGKPESKMLYEKLTRKMKTTLGRFKTESLACCIHFVSLLTFTFAAVKILKSKIRVDFTLSRKLNHPRITYSTPMSAHRFLYAVDITKETEITSELLEFLREARDIGTHQSTDNVSHE